MNNIGSRIKFLRTSYSMNQSVFAKTINISQASLSDLEKGKTKPSVDTLISISEQFNISLDWLIKGNPSFEQQYTNSEKLKGILDLIPKQILKNQNEILEKFNVTRNSLDQVYNIYLSEFFLTAFSSEEKNFLYSLRFLNPREKKELLDIFKLRNQA
ncbi:helix-turn-helix domain-containing protein [Lysinibacillus xylanilyticus]|uniref:helix-turn-helix domain-containing protein n=1 Tax=Lysinibacillus xylanilyticus TaxID=582475 RepID=UPI003D08DB6D